MPTTNFVCAQFGDYGYTAIGELERDNAEDIERIEWRVDSKISCIVRSAGSEKKSLKFEYDAMGNRIAKHVYEDNSFTFEALVKSTYYVRDASGNVMGTYEHTPDHSLNPPTVEFTCTERPIYGSSRVGLDVTQVVYTTATEALPEGQAVRLLGNKQYEIANHLGNVLVVVSDVKVIVHDGAVITGYAAQVISATDYSPFGAALEGRTYSSGTYRYGFNGQEKDDENLEGAYDFGARILDTRLGRWFIIDKLANSNHCVSEYAYIGNSPILFIDVNGEWWGVTTWFFEVQGGIGLCYGFNYIKRRGFSSDEVGTTHFIVESVVTIENQNLDQGCYGQPVLGITLGACVGFAQDYEHDTFDEMIGCRMTQSTNGVFAEVLPHFNPDGSLKTPSVDLKFGVGLESGDMGLGLTAGPQGGVMISYVQVYILESISITDAEEDLVDSMSMLPSQSWTVNENKNKVYNGASGEVCGFVSTLMANGVDTGTQIYSGAMKNEKGEIVSDNVWYTLDYRNEAAKANKEE